MALERALRVVQKKHPRLSVAIESGPEGPRWIQSSASIPVEFHDVRLDLGWHAFAERELATAFLPSTPPLLRIAALQDPSRVSQTVLILTFHHSIADGLSGIAFLLDLVDALNDHDVGLAPWRGAVEDLIPDLIAPLPPADNDITTRGQEKALRDVGRSPLWRQFEGDEPRIDSMELEGDSVERLRARCRAERTSVQGALCAALTLADAGARPADQYSILCPINVRQLAGVGPSEIGFFLSSGIVRSAVSQDLHFWELARKIIEELAAYRTEETVMRRLKQLQTILPQDADIDLASGIFASLSYDAVLSNLGAVQEVPSRRAITLEAVWGPMVLGRFRDERMIGAVTYKDVLRLTESRPGHLPGRLGAMGNILEAACQT